jgi:hypothetical protein
MVGVLWQGYVQRQPGACWKCQYLAFGDCVMSVIRQYKKFSVADRFSIVSDNLDVAAKVVSGQKEYMNMGPETSFALVILGLTFLDPLTGKLKRGRIRVKSLIF